MQLQEIIETCVSPVMTALLECLSVVLVGVITLAINALKKKFNVATDHETGIIVENLVKDVVHQINDQIVNDLKSKSEDGKLTKEEQKEVFQNALNLCFSLMDDKMITYLNSKYKNPDSVNTVIGFIIEKCVRDAKENSYVIVEDCNEQEEPSSQSMG